LKAIPATRLCFGIPPDVLLDAKNSLDENFPRRYSKLSDRVYCALATKNLLSELPKRAGDEEENQERRRKPERGRRRQPKKRRDHMTPTGRTTTP